MIYDTKEYETREYSKRPNDVQADVSSRTRGDALKNLRRFVLLCGFTLLAMGGLLMWRATHPALSDDAMIASQLEEMRTGVEKRQAASVTRYIGSGFSWKGMDAKTLRSALPQALLQWRDVKLSFSNLHITLRGDEATSAGRYSLTVQESPEASTTPGTYEGDFSLLWQKRDGKWQIVQATGGDSLPGIGGANDAAL